MKDRQIEKRAYSKEGFQIGFINSSNLNSANLQSFFLFLGQTFMASTKKTKFDFKLIWNFLFFTLLLDDL